MRARCVSTSSRSSRSSWWRRTEFQRRRRGDITPSCESQRFVDGFGQRQPSPFFFFELTPSGGGYRVEAGLPARLGGPPLRFEPLLVRHALQRRVERTFLDPQRVRRRLMDPLRDCVAVLRTRAVEHFEDQEIERALKAIVAVFRHSWLCIAGYCVFLDERCQTKVG